LTAGRLPGEPMKIHEYQAKKILQRFGVAVPEGRVVESADEAEAAYRDLGTEVQVVKAQIHAGGRGKGGGVRLVRGASEAREAAQAILSRRLVTHQTGPDGQVVRKLLVEKGSDIRTELYAGIAVDRKVGLPVLMASREGGVEIEEVAARGRRGASPRASSSSRSSGARRRRCSRGSAAPISRRTAASPRSTPSSSPAGAGSWPSTRR